MAFYTDKHSSVRVSKRKGLKGDGPTADLELTDLVAKRALVASLLGPLETGEVIVGEDEERVR